LRRGFDRADREFSQGDIRQSDLGEMLLVSGGAIASPTCARWLRSTTSWSIECPSEPVSNTMGTNSPSPICIMTSTRLSDWNSSITPSVGRGMAGVCASAGAPKITPLKSAGTRLCLKNRNAKLMIASYNSATRTIEALGMYQ
jgi:hypothetical protein